MFDQMKQLMEMKKQADQLKKDLEALVIESSDINGVKITLNGALSFKNLEISDGLASGDKKRLENELMRAVNAAIKKAQIKSAEKMKGMLPGLPGF